MIRHIRIRIFTFKVNARRTRKNYPMNSMEINMELGGRILDAFDVKVDVQRWFFCSVR